MATPAFFALLSHKIITSIPVMLFLHNPLAFINENRKRQQKNLESTIIVRIFVHYFVLIILKYDNNINFRL